MMRGGRITQGLCYIRIYTYPSAVLAVLAVTKSTISTVHLECSSHETKLLGHVCAQYRNS